MNGKDGHIDSATHRDSIFPSELDGDAEDQQTQTMFEPFATADAFNMTGGHKSSTKNNKGIPVQ